MAGNNDTLREAAARAGLDKLDTDHLAQLERAIQSARELGDKLPKDLHYSEELALTFLLPAPGSKKP